jgi:arylsulfatase A-like enzyme
VVGALLWGGLLALASRRRGAGRHLSALTLALAATIALGGQRYFFEQYSTYLNLDAAFFGLSFGETVGKLLRADRAAFVRAHGGPLAAAVALVVAGRCLGAGSRRWGALALGAGLGLLLVVRWPVRGEQAVLPDVLYLDAVAGVARAKVGLGPTASQVLPGARSPEYLPALVARPAAPRNVVFILTESVRFDSLCSDHGGACATTPETDAAVPSRIHLLQMRANDSATAVSVAVLMTGVSPASTRDEMHRAPMSWEYARAAGYDTAYWTSQDLRFGNSDMFVRDIGARLRVSGGELDPQADLEIGADDGELAAHVERHVGELREPYFAVVHTSNTHFPYLVHEDASPFQPAEFTTDPDRSRDFYNHYRNAIFLQDRAIARVVRAVRARPGGERTVIVFTSDHGEAFREHGQMGHTLSIFDEEVHVPFWVDAPEAALLPAERAALAARRAEPGWHLDVLPTFLDLMGIWNAPEIARFRARMPGAPLTGPPAAGRVMPLTNCAAVWGCPFKNWGLMRGSLKLEARQWDAGWHCWDTLADPLEQHDRGEAACGDLPAEARRVFGGSPGGR